MMEQKEKVKRRILDALGRDVGGETASTPQRRLRRRRRISLRLWPVWRRMTDPLELSLVAAAAAIRKREVSTEELTRLCLGHIEEHERVVNAFLGSAKLQTYQFRIDCHIPPVQSKGA